MPFLSVVTRCNHRPKALYSNIGSLALQTDKDYEQIFIVDNLSRGIGWANQQLSRQTERIHGDYVLVLDDDDEMSDMRAIALLKMAAEKNNKPDMIIFKMNHGDGKILPDDHVWKKEPKSGRIGMSSWIVRSDIWRAFSHAWIDGTEADYHWLKAVWNVTRNKVWIDTVLTQCQSGRSWGVTE